MGNNNTEEFEEVVEVEVEEKPKSKKVSKNNKSIIIFLVASILILGGGLYFAFNNILNSKDKKNEKSIKKDIKVTDMNVEKESKEKKSESFEIEDNPSKSKKGDTKKEENKQSQDSFIIKDMPKSEKHNINKEKIKNIISTAKKPTKKIEVKEVKKAPSKKTSSSKVKSQDTNKKEKSFIQEMKKVDKVDKAVIKKSLLYPSRDEMKLSSLKKTVEVKAYGLDLIKEDIDKRKGFCLYKNKKSIKEYVYYIKTETGYKPAYEYENWDGKGIVLKEKTFIYSVDRENNLIEFENDRFLPRELFKNCSVFEEVKKKN